MTEREMWQAQIEVAKRILKYLRTKRTEHHKKELFHRDGVKPNLVKIAHYQGKQEAYTELITYLEGLVPNLQHNINTATPKNEEES